MATRRWLGNAVATKQVYTITVANTWAAADTVTVTINSKDMVLTMGATVTTADVANALKEAYNGENFTNSDDAVLPLGGGASIGEHAELTATVSGSVVTLTSKTAGRSHTVTATESTAGDGTATLATSTTATGPNHFDNTENWSGATVPVDNDTIVFDSGGVDCLYALTPGIQPAAFIRTDSYTGKIGLADINRDNPALLYSEYRTTSLTFDNNAVTCTYTLESSGGRTRIDAGGGQSIFNVRGRGQREVSGVPEILLIGTHASNVVNCNRGDVGIAFYFGESATVATLRVGWLLESTSDSDVICGSGTTLTTIDKNGGDLDIDSDVTTLTQTGNGTLTINGTAAVTTLNLRGGTCYANSTGTITTVTVSGTGILDCSRDDRAKTITNPVEMYGARSQLHDPNKVIGSLVVDMNEAANTDNLDLGTHIRITRGSVA